MRKYKTLRHPLKAAIKKKFKTMEAFYEYTGIQKNTIYYGMTGKHSFRDDTKIIICDALDIDINELWGMLYQ